MCTTVDYYTKMTNLKSKCVSWRHSRDIPHLVHHVRLALSTRSESLVIFLHCFSRLKSQCDRGYRHYRVDSEDTGFSRVEKHCRVGCKVTASTGNFGVANTFGAVPEFAFILPYFFGCVATACRTAMD